MIKYKILQKILKFVNKIYIRPTYIGLDNIPSSNGFILAGNHTHLLDPLLIMSITNKNVHFLAKSSLFKFPKSVIFNNMGLIPVNRDGHDRNAYLQAVDYLKNKGIIAIFPEGTREKNRGILPFKKGAVRMSYETKTPIIPFAIVGKYRPFKKGITIKFAHPYKANKDIESSNLELRKIIEDLINE